MKSPTKTIVESSVSGSFSSRSCQLERAPVDVTDGEEGPVAPPAETTALAGGTNP